MSRVKAALTDLLGRTLDAIDLQQEEGVLVIRATDGYTLVLRVPESARAAQWVVRVRGVDAVLGRPVVGWAGTNLGDHDAAAATHRFTGTAHVTLFSARGACRIEMANPDRAYRGGWGGVVPASDLPRTMTLTRLRADLD